jgi:hypothetical protein
MKTNLRDFGITWIAFLLCVLCGKAFGETSTASDQFNLLTTSFFFPGGGRPNNNATIGDFCCTGQTGTILSDQRKPVGYIYFYGFPGGGLMCTVDGRKRSSAAQFEVLVSGVSHPEDVESERVQSSIKFNAREMKPGASRQTIAGALQFTATILGVEFTDSARSRYWMDSIIIRVDVQRIPVKQSLVLPAHHGAIAISGGRAAR